MEVASREDNVRRLDAISDRANRRSMIGVRQKVNPLRQQSFEDRFDNRFKAAMRGRTRERIRPSYDEDFKIPSQLEQANPVNLRINSMRVASVKDKVNKADHPGDISFGLFGSGDIGGALSPSSSSSPSSSPSLSSTSSQSSSPVFSTDKIKVTTYRPPNFLPVTTYRPKRFQNLKPNSFTTESEFIPVQSDFEDGPRRVNEGGVRRNFESNIDWGNSRIIPPVRKNLYNDQKNSFNNQEEKVTVRDFMDNIYKVENPIKPVRWSPPKQEKMKPVKDSFGSPFFTLDTSDFKGDSISKPEPTSFTPKVPSMSPMTPTYSTSMTPKRPERPLMFLPTMSPPDPSPSTTKSILSFEPEFDIKEEVKEDKDNFIGNVFVPTMSTNEDVRVSTSAARDAERRADMAYNAKKLSESTEKPDATSADPGPKSNSDNLRKWREELYNNPSPNYQDVEVKEEKSTTPKFEIDREFMQGRTRATKPTTTTLPDESHEKEGPKLFKNFIPTLPPVETLDNILEENAYSKTHIRAQKIVPKEVDKEEIVKDIPKHIDDDIELKGTKLIANNGNNYGKTFMGSLKPIDGGKVDYMDLTMTDITRVLPLSKLSTILKKHGYSASDIFNKNADALRIVGKAMKAKKAKIYEESSYPKTTSSMPRVVSSTTTEAPIDRIDEIDIEEAEDDDPYADLGIKFKEWSPNMKFDENEKKPAKSNVPKFKMPWPKRPTTTKKDLKKSAYNRETTEAALKSSWDEKDFPISTEKEELEKEKKYENTRVKTPKRFGWGKEDDEENVIEENDVEDEIEKEASTMSFKSLVKKISPMSLSEVLSHVGFSLPDIMRGNKEAIKEVLRYHRKALDPDAFKTKSTKSSRTKPEVTDEPEMEISKLSEVSELPNFSSDTTTTASSTTTEAPEPEKPTRKSAVNIFKNCKACKRLFNNVRSSTTTTTTSPPRFGERTSKDNIERTSPTNIRTLNQRKRKPIINDPIMERKYESIEDVSDIEDVNDVDGITTSYPNLNYTLANLNMSESDVQDKQDLKVPGIDQIFDLTNHAAKPDIIYGKKETEAPEESEMAKVPREPVAKSTKRPKVYKNTDPFFNNGAGGNRIRWNNLGNYGGGGGGYSGGPGGAGGGRIVTDRRTTQPTKKPTTRMPITYFGLEDELESSNPNDFLNGEYNGVNYEYEYDSYDYYGPVHEVPSGVKSALIASSVVGGLAVSIFLCIFMLCLWKNMKSKLRMSGDFDHSSQGFFSSLMFKKSKKDRKDPNGYFNKVLPLGEQHYSTTSSEEY